MKVGTENDAEEGTFFSELINLMSVDADTD